jgi:superfamily II DNA or RNA helicase
MISISEGPTKLQLYGDGRELRAVAQKLRFHPKGYFHSPKYKAYKITDGQDGWDGYISPIRMLEDNKADCLRGHKDKVISVARELGFVVSTRNCLKSPFAELMPDDLPNDLIAADFELDQYQREAVVHWLKNGMGVNKIAVNGGKTALFSATAAVLYQRFGDEGRILYITPSERLVRQAYKDIRAFLPGYDITQYGGSHKDNTGKDMVISTVAMLWKNHTALATSGFFRSFLAVFYDEAHHAAAPSSSKLMMLMPAFFRLGASDTKKEGDPAAMTKIQGLLGPVRYTVSVGTYIDSGRSAKPSIYIVESPGWYNRFKDCPHNAVPDTPAWALVDGKWKKGIYLGPVYERDEQGRIKMRKKRELEDTVNESEVFTGSGTTETIKQARWSEVEVPVTVDGFHQIKFDGDDPTPYEVESTYCLLDRVTDQAIVKFKERNSLIVDWVRYYSQEKKFPTLVVCTRTLHIYILQAMIEKVVGEAKVQILLGDHTSKERDTAFDWFRHTPGGVLISPLVQEGVSINEIRAGVIADYVGSWERANQIIGRFIRKKQEDNTASITWFLDTQCQSLRKGCKEVFNKLFDIRGYTFIHPVTGPASIGQAKVYEKLD